MICKYEVIAPVTNRKIPYLDNRGFFIIPNIGKEYKYYVEVKRYNPNKFCYQYFLLLNTYKFDPQCKKCRVDDYGRLKLKLHDELLEFATSIMRICGNVKTDYIESESDYDVWEMS